MFKNDREPPWVMTNRHVKFRNVVSRRSLAREHTRTASGGDGGDGDGGTWVKT